MQHSSRSKAKKALLRFVKTQRSYFAEKNGLANAGPCTSIHIPNKGHAIVPKLIGIADGSGSIAFKNESISRSLPSPNTRSRLANFIENFRQLYIRFDRLWFFGEKSRLDTRSPKDGIPTLDLLQNMLDANFYSSSTYTDAIGPVFEDLCKSDDTNPTVLLIMTDGMINEPGTFSRLVRDAVKQIPLGNRCGLVHIVLWIALHVSQNERDKIRTIYTDLQNQIKNSAITLHCLYEDARHFALPTLINELLEPVAIIPSGCVGLSGAFWKEGTAVSDILKEVNDSNSEHGVGFVQELSKFVESLIRAENFPESDLYAMIYRLLSSFRKSPNPEIAKIATQIMDKISAQKQSGTNRAFWDKVTADSTAVSGSKDTIPALKLVSENYMTISNLDGHMSTMSEAAALAIRDGSFASLIGFLKKWLRDPVVTPIAEMPDKLGMPIVRPAFSHHDPVIARDMMSNLFRSFGLPHVLQGSGLFTVCLFFVYTADIQVPPGVRDACLTVIKDRKWVQTIIFESDGITLKPYLLAPAFAPLMYAAMKDIDFGSSSMEILKRMHRVSFALNKARSTSVGPLEVNISSGLRASKQDIILLTLLAWGSTQNPMPKIPDFVRVKGFSKDGRMIIIWLDNGSEFRMEFRSDFYMVVGQNIPDDVVRMVRELMEGYRRDDVPDSVSARTPDQTVLGTRTSEVLDILKPYGPKPRCIEISNEIVMRVLREAFPALFGVQGSHMERCKQLAEGTRFLEPLSRDKLGELNIIIDGAQLPVLKIEEIIRRFLDNCELQCTQLSFTCSSCFGKYPVGYGCTMCENRHMVCSECFNDYKETMTFGPGSVVNSTICTCWICRGKWPDITLVKLGLMTNIKNFIRSPPPGHELNVFKICSVDKCCSIFEAGPKSCADDGAELPSECEAHRKQTSFACPKCQMQYQYVTGCTLIRCCLHPNEYGQRGYHSCRNDEGDECNHCLDPDCDEERCYHAKGCGHVFHIGSAELQIGN